MSLAHPRHPYTTLLHDACHFWLAGSWAASRERSLAWRGGEGCWQTRGGWEPAQVLGCSGEQARMRRGIAEHIGFLMGHRGKLQRGQTERPRMPAPHTLPWPKLRHFCSSWGLSWLEGDELRDVSSEHFVLQTPSTKAAVNFNFTCSEKSEIATPHQEKWQGSL